MPKSMTLARQPHSPEVFATIRLLFHPELLSDPTELALELTSLW